MRNINELIEFIEVQNKSLEKDRESLDSLLYESIINTLKETKNNYEDDFREQVVINFLVLGDDKRYSLTELEEYIKDIKK